MASRPEILAVQFPIQPLLKNKQGLIRFKHRDALLKTNNFSKELWTGKKLS